MCSFNNSPAPTIQQLLANNADWSRKMTEGDDDYFRRLSNQQKPAYLWIGCSDSRVPANDIVGLLPGELFVHRNVANLVYPTDFNCLSVLEYAINVLEIRHIIVCGHYGCGGVRAAIDNQMNYGHIDCWLSKIRDLYAANRPEIDELPTADERVDRMCEMNVIEQVKTIARLPVVQQAWFHGKSLSIHGWVYGLKNGLVKSLGMQMNALEQVEDTYRYQIDLGNPGGR